MFKPNDYVVYKRSVCQVKSITKNSFANKDYYTLIPIDDNSLTINIPVENEISNLRNIITKKDAEALINSIPSISIIKSEDKMLETEYKRLLSTDKLEDLISIIKTTYLRNDERKKAGKKIGDKDNTYFNRAEKYLYNELSLALNMNYEEVKKYIFKKVDELSK